MVYKNYTLTIGNSTESYSLVYELNHHRPTQEWARLMLSVTPDELRQGFNPWVGLLSTNEHIHNRVSRFNQLIVELNEWIPNRIDDIFNQNDYQNCLNKLHIHFPELEATETDLDRLRQLSEYNDIIHELEHIFREKNNERLMIVLCPRMNETVPLNDEDYNLFDPNVKFGEMVLHYPHVGRNCFELLKAGDINCPIDQFKPQSMISPYHHLRFFDDMCDTVTYNKKFSEFYSRSSIKQVIDIDDPKKAFGFIKLGKLKTTLPHSEILNIIRSCNRIISWKIT